MSSGSDEGEYSSIQDRNRSLKEIRREDPKKPTSVEGEGYGWPRVSWPSRPPPDPTQQTSVRVLDDMHDGSNPKVHQRREGYCADAEPTGGGPYPPDDEEEDVAPRAARLRTQAQYCARGLLRTPYTYATDVVQIFDQQVAAEACPHPVCPLYELFTPILQSKTFLAKFRNVL